MMSDERDDTQATLHLHSRVAFHESWPASKVLYSAGPTRFLLPSFTTYCVDIYRKAKTPGFWFNGHWAEISNMSHSPYGLQRPTSPLLQRLQPYFLFNRGHFYAFRPQRQYDIRVWYLIIYHWVQRKTPNRSIYCSLFQVQSALKWERSIEQNLARQTKDGTWEIAISILIAE